MTTDAKLIPSGSQTVGPYFRIGLQYLIDSAPAPEEESLEWITIRGQVLDRDGTPVSDAMLEFWTAATEGNESPKNKGQSAYPSGFRRAATDTDGSFSVTIRQPVSVALDDGSMQAPHLLVLVYARGLLRHLISRVYISDRPADVSDPILLQVPPERRSTLIAQPDGLRSFRWNVRLQGKDETVFFVW